jgi:glycosyltransferase involved in cell wall biosynthesis
MNPVKSSSNLNAKTSITIVVPVFNEAEVIMEFHNRLIKVLDSLPALSEIFYVNDGSTDGTLNIIKAINSDDPRAGIIDLSRNFGKEIAMTAGIDHARGDAVIILDADLQDPPELIPVFIDNWLNGYDVVYGKRTDRRSDTLFKRASSFLFYRLIQRLSRVHIPEDTGDFRLLSRRAVESLNKLRERHRFMKGLFSWIGYPQKAVPYARPPRLAGKTKWNFLRLWDFAMEGITSFTTAPLKIASYIGLITALGAFVFSLIIIYRTIVLGDPVKGYPSLMVVILFLGGIQLIGIGIIGEYLSRIFGETKGRPLYLVNGYVDPTNKKGLRNAASRKKA